MPTNRELEEAEKYVKDIRWWIINRKLLDPHRAETMLDIAAESIRMRINSEQAVKLPEKDGDA